MAKLLEVPFYRQLVLDHMEATGFEVKNHAWDLHDPEEVHKAMVQISAEQNQKGHQKRWAFYIGQLALLDFIAKMQSEYTAIQEAGNGRE